MPGYHPIIKFLVQGEMLSITEACRKFGYDRGTITNRMKMSELTLEEALLNYDKTYRHLVDGEYITVKEASIKYKISAKALSARMFRNNISLKEAIEYKVRPKQKYQAGEKLGAHLIFTGKTEVKKGQKYYEVKCSCGRVFFKHINKGRSKGGCQGSDCQFSKNKRHGLSKSKEYTAWAGMISRCYSEGSCGYANYGGRGITVSDEFRNSFKTFYEYIGPAPSKSHSLDRINNLSGNYERGNLRWATQAEQNENRRERIKRSSYEALQKENEILRKENKEMKAELEFRDAPKYMEAY